MDLNIRSVLVYYWHRTAWLTSQPIPAHLINRILIIHTCYWFTHSLSKLHMHSQHLTPVSGLVDTCWTPTYCKWLFQVIAWKREILYLPPVSAPECSHRLRPSLCHSPPRPGPRHWRASISCKRSHIINTTSRNLKCHCPTYSPDSSCSFCCVC